MATAQIRNAPADESVCHHVPLDPSKRVQTKDVLTKVRTTFQDVITGNQDLLHGITSEGFEALSPVQLVVIPDVIRGKDVLARAKNGTGKTLAYLIPALMQIDTAKPHVQSMIIVPSRELAQQVESIAKSLTQFYKNPLRVGCFIGGRRLSHDDQTLRKRPHLIVGTPGRLADHVANERIDLSRVSFVALDEADHLMGFEEMPLLLESCADGHQTVAVSATLPADFVSFRDEHMRVEDLAVHNLMQELTLIGVHQYYVYLEERLKVKKLRSLVRKLKLNQMVVFTNEVDRTKQLASVLNDKLRCTVGYITSDMTQAERDDVFVRFNSGNLKVLVATDVFGRGIDNQAVNCVVNFDLPLTTSSYLHRIGRGGRWGHHSLAINFVTDDDRVHLYTIERELQREMKPLPQVVPEEEYVL